ncbi:hypothetical protein LTR94_037551, partial [Friedmanniomyces endolithicus]
RGAHGDGSPAGHAGRKDRRTGRYGRRLRRPFAPLYAETSGGDAGSGPQSRSGKGNRRM